jgi:glyoxylase-like metal-dependent hydrolase (beta-lactamase superfamily II)
VRGRETIQLGGVSVTLVPTPGHTPGTISALIPVTDGGEPHTVVLSGGGQPFGSLPAMKTFAVAIEDALQVVIAAKADVLISNHPKNDGSLGLMKALMKRRAGEPNPFVIGTEAVAQRVTMVHECTLAWIARNGP